MRVLLNNWDMQMDAVTISEKQIGKNHTLGLV